MGIVNRSQSVLRLEINLLLFYIGAIRSCIVSVKQPGYLEVDYTHKAVTIECTFSTSGCPSHQPLSLWFRYGVHQAEHLCSETCRSEADKFTTSKVLDKNKVSLTINRLSSNDSAIYICGIAFSDTGAPRAKQTGHGTTLVVRESKLLSKELQSVFIALLVLLSIFIIGICVIFGVLSKSKSNTLKTKETKEDSQKKRSARRIFQEIAQELYHKRYVETSQQPEKQ
ncbi:immunoglobulin superfamily member 6 isoform X2 [Cavia porcellus]|uniref:immunoglobulin superfamily member 6 isoform X2 n=1 Tax=Cavia porcellus TaxID=10141 RepID=UPI000661938A|nr:immunoglobulin superfamily member 6 isoform X2 [Cavia porcellus]